MSRATERRSSGRLRRSRPRGVASRSMGVITMSRMPWAGMSSSRRVS